MNNTFTLEELAIWVESLLTAAKKDTIFAVDFFNGTKDAPVCIVGGWADGFCHEQADLFCCSKETPGLAMSIKIVVNNTPYAYTDFDSLRLPLDSRGAMDDTSIVLEWEDDPKMVAQFFFGEWERIMENYK